MFSPEIIKYKCRIKEYYETLNVYIQNLKVVVKYRLLNNHFLDFGILIRQQYNL
jgi:hypothetical protein